MRTTLVLMSCVMVLATLGCRDEGRKSGGGTDNGANTANTPRRPPVTTQPGARLRKLPPPVIAAPSGPSVKPADASRVYAQELTLLRRHRWSQTPSAAELAAAGKIFEGRTGDPKPDLRKAVDFIGLPKAKVKAMLGNPRYKQTLNNDEIWTYSYAARGQNITYSMKFRNGTVVPDVNLQVASGR